MRQLLPVTGTWIAATCDPANAGFPDGKHIAAVLPSGIVSVDVETGDLRQLTKGAMFDSAPAVSPDGRTLAFVRWRAVEADDIYLL